MSHIKRSLGGNQTAVILCGSNPVFSYQIGDKPNGHMTKRPSGVVMAGLQTSYKTN